MSVELQRMVDDIKSVVNPIMHGFLFIGVPEYHQDNLLACSSDNITNTLEAVSAGLDDEEVNMMFVVGLALKAEPQLIKLLEIVEKEKGKGYLYTKLCEVVEHNANASPTSLAFEIKSVLL